jgi:sphingolipid delta-4 desaturase
MAQNIRHYSWGVLLAAAYAIGGTVNHTLQLAVHDLSHNLAFKSRMANQWLAMFANLVTGVPSAVTFVKYHMEHHQFQGVNGVDTDIPSDAEALFFGRNAVLKAIWLFLQPFFYAIRPLFVSPKAPDVPTVINFLWCALFDFAIYHFWGGKALTYLISGSLLGMGLHPVAGHFIAEHYVFSAGHETYSYYGWCNFFNLNVGYHNEHHDFPKVPWTRLPEVKRMAPEYYDDLPYYTSYVALMWRFITDPSISLYSRVKRPTPEELRGQQAAREALLTVNKKDK